MSFRFRIIDALYYYNNGFSENCSIFSEVIMNDTNYQMYENIKEGEMIRIYNL